MAATLIQYAHTLMEKKKKSHSNNATLTATASAASWEPSHMELEPKLQQHEFNYLQPQKKSTP